jgi:hypothetical protein
VLRVRGLPGQESQARRDLADALNP